LDYKWRRTIAALRGGSLPMPWSSGHAGPQKFELVNGM
jgi:hypothetical protein